MRIGELAARTGVKAELIRYYERIGLIAQPSRSAGNYRSYAEEDERRLILIKDCRDLGFEIEDVRFLIRGEGDSGASSDCPAKIADLLAKLKHKADRLRHLRAQLTQIGVEKRSKEDPS